MFKTPIYLATFVVISSGLVAEAEFDVNFRRKYEEASAEKLFSQRKYDEAQKAFAELAATARDEVGKAKWTARAAIALGHQKEKYEQALEKAKSIEKQPYSVYARMNLLNMKRKYEAIVKAFADEEIAEWPPWPVPEQLRNKAEDVRTYALYYRGQAFYRTGNGEAAEQDLSRAVELVNDMGLKRDIWLTMAHNRTNNLNDAEKAYDAYANIAETGGGGATYFRGVIGAANYLTDQEKYDQALDVISKMDPHNQKGWWHGSGLLTLGRILTAAGRTEEAIAAYRELLEAGKAHRNHRGPAALNLGKLLAKAGRTDEAITAYKKVVDGENFREGDREKAREAIKKLQND